MGLFKSSGTLFICFYNRSRGLSSYLHAAKQPIRNVFVATRWVVKPRLAPTGISHDIKTTKRAHPAPSCHSMLKKRLTGSSGSVCGLIQGGFGSVAHSSARSRRCTPALQPWLARMGIICLPFNILCGTQGGLLFEKESFHSLPRAFGATSEAKCPCAYNIPKIYLYIWKT